MRTTAIAVSMISTVCSFAIAQVTSHIAPDPAPPPPRSAQYEQVQQRLARGWNTWDVHSVATQVLLPEGLAIHVGLKHNSTLNGDDYLGDVLIGRLTPGAEVVTPGPHAWDGSYTDLTIEWKGHKWRLQTAHDGEDMVMLVTPLPSKPVSALPPTVVFSVDTLWNGFRTIRFLDDGSILAIHGREDIREVTCTCSNGKHEPEQADLPLGASYFAAELTGPVGVGTAEEIENGKFPRSRTLEQIQAIINREKAAYEDSLKAAGKNAPILGAIETTIGWDTIYDPEKARVISPITRVWSVDWGGYVLADWDNFFAATLASVGSRDLAYAGAMEMLREETTAGFVPNYARAGNWKSSDRSEPPVGAITVLGLYEKFHDRWFIEDAFEPLMKWNRWWAEHRDIQGYLAWGSDGKNQPENLDDTSRGTWQGAIFESGLDNSPMYDGTFYNPESHLVEYADVGLMSLYIADCDALAKIADALGKAAESKELNQRAARYRAKLATMWDDQAGIFLNVDLHTGRKNTRLSPTNFYPLLAQAATPEQARTMIEKHLKNPEEFWGQWVIPSIERNDPAFKDQNYWRGRIWGPMNYLVYLGLQNYADSSTRSAFAQKSYDLFLKEWTEHGHVHENYNAITGSGDDVSSSDRFYHWGALLGYIEYLEQGTRK